jgi:hypothetical protein
MLIKTNYERYKRLILKNVSLTQRKNTQALFLFSCNKLKISFFWNVSAIRGLVAAIYSNMLIKTVVVVACIHAVIRTRGVQIRSDSFGFRNGSCFVVGSDRTSILRNKWINYPRQRGCRCIIRLILQLDVTLSASWHAFLAFIFIWLNISTWMRHLCY